MLLLVLLLRHHAHELAARRPTRQMLGAASVSVALLASEIGGPGSPYARSHPRHPDARGDRARSHSTYRSRMVSSSPPAIRSPSGLFWRGARWDPNWPSMTVNYLLVVSVALCALRGEPHELALAPAAPAGAKARTLPARGSPRSRARRARCGSRTTSRSSVKWPSDPPREGDASRKRVGRSSARRCRSTVEEPAHGPGATSAPATTTASTSVAWEHLVGHDFAEMVKLFGPRHARARGASREAGMPLPRGSARRRPLFIAT